MNSTSLSNKVVATVSSEFSGEEIDLVLEALALYGIRSFEREPERVQLAILKLFDGNLDLLGHFVDSAKADYRDVLYWTEYNDENPPEKAKKEGAEANDRRR